MEVKPHTKNPQIKPDLQPLMGISGWSSHRDLYYGYKGVVGWKTYEPGEPKLGDFMFRNYIDMSCRNAV